MSELSFLLGRITALELAVRVLAAQQKHPERVRYALDELARERPLQRGIDDPVAFAEGWLAGTLPLLRSGEGDVPRKPGDRPRAPRRPRRSGEP